MVPAIEWPYSLSGFAVGLLVGLTGVGGGSLMTPLLVLVFGFHPAKAVGTDLLYAACTKTVGTAAHGIAGTVEWRIVGWLLAGSLPASLATLGWLLHKGAPSDAVSRVISMALGVALLLTAASLLARQRWLGWIGRRAPALPARRTAWLTVLTGAVLGVLVSLSSVGAGAIGVTILLALYPQLPTPRIVGSDIAHAVPLTLLAGIGHWWIGSVDLTLLASLLVGSVPGVLLGSVLTRYVSDRLLRPILASVLLLAGGKLLA